jgi:hypothetical protein
MESWIIGGTIFLGIFFLAWFFGWLISTILDDYETSKRLKKFENTLKESIKYSEPSLEEIKIIAINQNVTQNEIKTVFENILIEILSGKSKELDSFKEDLKLFIEQFKLDEPFKDVPNEIRIQLELLRGKLNGDILILEPLTTKIKELLRINNKKRRRERIIAGASFVIGLSSFIYSIVIQLIK